MKRYNETMSPFRMLQQPTAENIRVAFTCSSWSDHQMAPAASSIIQQGIMGNGEEKIVMARSGGWRFIF